MILYLDTSTERGLLQFGSQIKLLPYGLSSSEHLATAIAELLDGAIPTQIACGVGPGSYTGMRVAASYAKHLALAWNLPLASFCSCDLFAASEGKSCVLFDARSAGCYTRRYQDGKPLSEACKVSWEDLPNYAAGYALRGPKEIQDFADLTVCNPSTEEIGKLVFESNLSLSLLYCENTQKAL